MTPDERPQRYADLAVRVGVNVQPGQDVVVNCLVEHAEIARAIARAAYRAGAKHVVLNYGDLHLRRAAVHAAPRAGAKHVVLNYGDLHLRRAAVELGPEGSPSSA